MEIQHAMNEIFNSEPLVAGIRKTNRSSHNFQQRSDYSIMSLQYFNPKIKEATNIIPFKSYVHVSPYS